MFAARSPSPTSDLSDSGSDESDRELREAFERGELKPGLNRIVERDDKTYANNAVDTEAKLEEIRLNLPWVERLDLVNAPAPTAPDVALQLQEATRRSINIRANNAKLPRIDINDDPVLNEFKRETLFHRQAQATASEALERLHSLGIVTKRPETYFAEMAKTDVHMQKVRQNLMAKQAGQARAEKVRQLRQQKKMGKQLQAQTKLQRAAEKKASLNEVKKYRKGLQNRDDPVPDRPGKRSAAKKNMKNQKFGFGGKKKGSKLNTRESSFDFREYGKSGVKNNKKTFKRSSGITSKKTKRLGKARRVNNKSKRKG